MKRAIVVIVALVVASAILGVVAWKMTRPSTVLATSVLDGPLHQTDLALVSGIARSSDGNTIATVSDNRVVKLWDAKSGQLLHVLRGDSEWDFSPSFSPDGSLLATATTISSNHRQYGRLQIWNTNTGDRVFTVDNLDWPKCARFSPLGNLIAVGANSDIYLVDASNYGLIGHLERPFNNRTLVTMSFDSSGNLLAAVGQDGTVKLWKMPLFELQRTFDVGTRIVKASIPGEGSSPVPAASVAFSHDGKLLAANNQEGTVYVWDIATGNEVIRHAHGPLQQGQSIYASVTNSLAFTSDDQWLITTNRFGSAIELLSASRKAEFFTPLATHTDAPIVAFDASLPNDTVAFAYRVYAHSAQPASSKFEVWTLQLPQ